MKAELRMTCRGRYSPFYDCPVAQYKQTGHLVVG